MPTNQHTLLERLRSASETELHLQRAVDLAKSAAKIITADGTCEGMAASHCSETCRLIARILMYADQPGWMDFFALAWSNALQDDDMAQLTKVAANLANLYEGSLAPVPVERFRFAALQTGYAAAELSKVPGLWIVVATVYGEHLGRSGANAQSKRIFGRADSLSREQLSDYAPDLLSSLLFKEAVASISTREVRAAEQALHACREHSKDNPYRQFECHLLSACIETLRYNFHSALCYIEKAQNLVGTDHLNRTAMTKIMHTWRTVHSRRTAAGQPFEAFAPRLFEPVTISSVYRLALQLDAAKLHASDAIRPAIQNFSHAMRINQFAASLRYS